MKCRACHSILALVVTVGANAWGASLTVYPAKDGTLADGGVYGSFDGMADNADWYFNESSYEGSISLSQATLGSNLEHRVVWEYSLSAVALTPPVAATLNVRLRGAPVFPRPDAPIHVYAYPADLEEAESDFSATPLAFIGVINVPAFQSPTLFALDVSGLVSDALTSGDDKVAFRFQVDPQTPNSADQAFIDALDSDVTTKPYLLLDAASALLGDIDEDGDVDLDDYEVCSSCLLGPETAPDLACEPCDFDADTDVDLGDFHLFQTYFTNGS